MATQKIDYAGMTAAEREEHHAALLVEMQRDRLMGSVEQFETMAEVAGKLLRQYVKAPDDSQALLWKDLSAALSDTGRLIRQIQSTWRAASPKKEGGLTPKAKGSQKS